MYYPLSIILQHNISTVYGRTSRPAAHMSDAELVCLVSKNDKDKCHTLNGWAAALTIWPIHDGTTDSFSSLPPDISKKFKNTNSIRSHMSFATSSKVFAVVLENYVSKGVFKYEVSNVKIRLGFGKADFKYVAPESTTRADMESMFTKPRALPNDVAPELAATEPTITSESETARGSTEIENTDPPKSESETVLDDAKAKGLDPGTGASVPPVEIA